MDNFEEMIEQLVDLMQDKEKYIDKDDPNDIIAKDVKALHYAIDLLKYYKQKIEEYKNEKLTLLDRIDEKEYKIQMYEDLLNDYRRIYQIIYKLIVNKED